MLLVLWLEASVQIVELIWYFTVAWYMFVHTADSNNEGVKIEWRYADWVVTTPVMLVSIFVLVLWENEGDAYRCTPIDALLGHPSRVAALVCMVLADWAMLAVGFWHKRASEKAPKPPRWTIFLGFVPFAGALTPHVVALETLTTAQSAAAVVAVTATACTWLLYGVVATLCAFDKLLEIHCNTAYNVLDIFSKNVVGFVVAGIGLGAAAQCK